METDEELLESAARAYTEKGPEDYASESEIEEMQKKTPPRGQKGE